MWNLNGHGKTRKFLNQTETLNCHQVGFVENYYVKQDFGSGAGGNRWLFNRPWFSTLFHFTFFNCRRQKFAELKSIQERKRDQSQRENWLDATKVTKDRAFVIGTPTQHFSSHLPLDIPRWFSLKIESFLKKASNKTFASNSFSNCDMKILLVRLEVAEDSHVLKRQIIIRIKFSKPPKLEVSLVEDGFALVVWENRSSCASARPEVHASWLRTRGPTTMDKYGHASQRPRHCRSQYFSSQV